MLSLESSVFLDRVYMIYIEGMLVASLMQW